MNKKHILFFAALIIAFGACRKDKETLWDNTTAKDNSASESYFSDLFKVVADVSENTEGIREYGIGCIDSVLVDTVSSPRSIRVYFGEDQCVAEDGRVRKGDVLITYSGRYRDQGTVITVTPINFRINEYLIEGTKVITNLGLDENGYMSYSILVDGSVTAPGNAYTTTWVSDRTRTWIEGSDTPTIWDDAYQITGNASGTNRIGDPYTMSITEALRAEVGCPWIVSGKLSIQPSDGQIRIVDFGSGDCNGGFTVIVNGTNYEINGGN